MSNVDQNTQERTTLSLRCLSIQRDLIDLAAGTVGKTRTEFMLETSCQEAKRVLLDQQTFSLPDEAYQEFVKRLDQPVDNAKLRALLGTKSPWER